MTPDLTNILAGASPLTLVFAWFYIQEKNSHEKTKDKYSNLVDQLLKKMGHDV